MRRRYTRFITPLLSVLYCRCRHFRRYASLLLMLRLIRYADIRLRYGHMLIYFVIYFRYAPLYVAARARYG